MPLEEGQIVMVGTSFDTFGVVMAAFVHDPGMDESSSPVLDDLQISGVTDSFRNPFGDISTIVGIDVRWTFNPRADRLLEECITDFSEGFL